MKRYINPAVLLPAMIGLIMGAVLFWLGSQDDAPGLSLIGLSVAYLMVMWGMNNAGVIKKGLLVPLLLLSFGGGGILLSILLLLDGEFENMPGLALVGVALGLALIGIGTVMARKRRGKRR